MEKMLASARQAQKNAYAPYSNFLVGASIRTKNNDIYSGCNVENASYGLTQCAEANAIGSMIAAGENVIREILVLGKGPALCMPCGSCRQLLSEFSSSDVPVHICDEAGHKKTITLGKLLPLAFTKAHLT